MAETESAAKRIRNFLSTVTILHVGPKRSPLSRPQLSPLSNAGDEDSTDTDENRPHPSRSASLIEENGIF
jgi:hypothetical protein